jgi:hypothetical protein
MAYLYIRKSGRVEIREAHSTPRGPRSRTLASFKGTLTEQHLDRAESASTHTLDRSALCARAKELGIPTERSRAGSHARRLTAQLRQGARLDPVLVGVLREQLDGCESAPLPDALADVVEWLGASDQERGRALRDVLRLYDRIRRSRDAVREPDAPRFPCFDVRPERRAS